MKRKQRFAHFVCTRPVSATLAISILTGALAVLLTSGLSAGWGVFLYLPSYIYASILIGAFLISPGVITIYNICYLAVRTQSEQTQKAGRYIEYTTIVFGAFCSFLWAQIRQIRWDSDWMVQLHNGEHHTPIATWTAPTVIVLAAVAFVGYLLLRLRRISTLPPLLATLAISAMYLGGALCVTWCIQLIAHDPVLCLYPVNLLLIGAKVVKEMVLSQKSEEHPIPQGKSKLILAIHHFLAHSENWPWLGILCALPLLGLIIAILTLFGQAPDSIIQAWTQTSDWTFSQQVAPQNIYMDQHYLCTVAAGGHKKIVKPLRVGKRHGHRVLVNRQLCVANAFEQLLMEKLPRTHRVIRSIYDRYGYPIAKHIKSPYVADAIWFLMKPLEWLFLVVLYLCDTKPENRIAVQYPHAPLPDHQ